MLSSEDSLANEKPLRCFSRRLWTGLFRKSAERCADTHLATNVRNGEIVQISLKRLDLREQIGCLPPRRDFSPWRHGRTDLRRNGGAGQARKRVEALRHPVPSRTSPAARVIAESGCPSRAFILLVRCSCHSLTDAQPWLSIQRYPPATRRLTRRLEKQLEPLGKQLGTNGLPATSEQTGGTSGSDGFEDKVDKCGQNRPTMFSFGLPRPHLVAPISNTTCPSFGGLCESKTTNLVPFCPVCLQNPVVLSCRASCPELFSRFPARLAERWRNPRKTRSDLLLGNKIPLENLPRTT